ncbi:TcaA NTF2-like domain-containing protein [Pontibacillus salipaludis]|uniref:Membrane protein YvbJ n=1 Tax=Pontibacillus salipaludis TaxID=1697394 RepID=A0ABQ1Q210_9BACI|nr:hypothetical protein [Pontibacillus salipaludis]GGD10056.1 hypothetical protein GCM10011389_16980 [Pontibacillus salipaludis]
MRFCTECGHTLSEEQDFCTSCGAQFSNNPTDHYDQPARPMSKKRKWTLGSIGILAVVLFFTHMALSSIFDPMKKIQAMDQAMKTKDSSALMDELSLEEEALLNKEEYLTYLSEAGWETMKEQFSQIVEANKDDKTAQQIVNDYGEPVFLAKKRAIIPKLFYTYDMEALPATISVHSALAPSSIITAGEHSVEITNTDTSYNLAKAYPGTFKIHGEAQNEYGTFENQLEVHIDQPGTKQEFSFPFEYKNYSLSSNESSAILYINGTSTGLPLSELNQIGPVPVKESIKVHAEWATDSGDVLRSEVIDTLYIQGDHVELTIEKPKVVEKTPEPKEEEKEQESTIHSSSLNATAEAAANHVVAFRSAYEQALNEHNFNLIEPYLQNGSHAEEELYDYLRELNSSVYTYDFKENSIIQANKSASDTFEVDMEEMFIFTNHLSEQTRYDRTKRYIVVYENGFYKIQKILINDTIRENL